MTDRDLQILRHLEMYRTPYQMDSVDPTKRRYQLRAQGYCAYDKYASRAAWGGYCFWHLTEKGRQAIAEVKT